MEELERDPEYEAQAAEAADLGIDVDDPEVCPPGRPPACPAVRPPVVRSGPARPPA